MTNRVLGYLFIGLIALAMGMHFLLGAVGVLLYGLSHQPQAPESGPADAPVPVAEAAPAEASVPGEIRVTQLKGIHPEAFFEPIRAPEKEPVATLINQVLAGDWSPRTLQRLSRQRDRALRELRLLYEGTEDLGGKARIVAVMDQLGERSAREQLARKVLETDAESQATIFESMRVNYLWKGEFTPSETALLEALAASGPPAQRSRAASTLAADPAGAGTAIELFETISPELRRETASRMAADNRAAAAAPVLFTLFKQELAEEAEGDRWIEAMTGLLNLSRNAEPPIAQEALNRAEVEFWKQDGKERYDPRLAQAWYQAAAPTSRGILADILANAESAETRAYAFGGLARIEGEKRLPEAIERIASPETAFGGYLALSELHAAGHGDAISTALGENPTLEPSPELIQFMIDRGDAEALGWLQDRLEELGPLQQMQVTWLQRGLRLENLAIALEQAGLTPRTVDLAALRENSRDETSGEIAPDYELVWTYLDQAGIAFPVALETGRIPVALDQLVKELADFSKGDLDLLHWEQHRDVKGYEVRFIHGDEVYQFRASDLGTRLDLLRVLEALNGALIHSRQSPRFLYTEVPGDLRHVVYGDPKQWDPIRETFSLPLSETPVPVLRREESLSP